MITIVRNQAIFQEIHKLFYTYEKLQQPYACMIGAKLSTEQVGLVSHQTRTVLIHVRITT